MFLTDKKQLIEEVSFHIFATASSFTCFQSHVWSQWGTASSGLLYVFKFKFVLFSGPESSMVQFTHQTAWIMLYLILHICWHDKYEKNLNTSRSYLPNLEIHPVSSCFLSWACSTGGDYGFCGHRTCSKRIVKADVSSARAPWHPPWMSVRSVPVTRRKKLQIKSPGDTSFMVQLQPLRWIHSQKSPK